MCMPVPSVLLAVPMLTSLTVDDILNLSVCFGNSFEGISLNSLLGHGSPSLG